MTTTPEPWNLTETQRRQIREAHARQKTEGKPPREPWSVSVDGRMPVYFRGQRAAYEHIAALGSAAEVRHWEDGRYVLYERIEATP